MSGFPTRVQRQIRQRSGGVCEGCGVREATQMHHCQYRSKGGPEVASNGLHLCGSGNHTGCHGDAHGGKAAEAIGWSIRSGFDPLLVPKLLVVDGRQGWFRLDDEGGREPIAEADALEYLHLIGARRAA